MTHIPRGTAADAPWAVKITPESAGWTYAGLRVVDLSGGSVEFATGDELSLIHI